MQIVITMAGLGSRFRKAGYDMPKYEITVHGRSLFAWSMESLKGYDSPSNDHYFIVRREDDAASFIRSECEKLNIQGGIRIIEIDSPTDGQATTAMIAADMWKKEEPLLVYNIDTYVRAGSLRTEDLCGDGFIPCFVAPGDHWSFVAADEDGIASEVREKQRISDNCTIGAYYFSTCSLYERIYHEYYSDPAGMEKGEKYIAPMYNHMISKGMQVRICLIDPSDVHVLGTPEELEEFAKEEI